MAKFSPYRMSEKVKKSVLVALGVLLMFVFALPSGSGCRKDPVWGQDPSTILCTVDGTSYTYAEGFEFARRQGLAFGGKTDPQTAAFGLVSLHEAEKAGIHISDEQVRDFIQKAKFPRMARAEWAIAKTSDFADSAAAKQALSGLRSSVTKVTGAAYQDALKRLAADTKITFGECSRPVSSLRVKGELREIAEAPEIVDRVFKQLIGDCSKPLPLPDGWCILRVIDRRRGFGPDGKYYSKNEGWIRAGFGTLNSKQYKEELRAMNLTQAELERAVREYLILPRWSPRGQLEYAGMPGGLVLDSLLSLPWATYETLNQRDASQAVPAWFAIHTSDFMDGVTLTDEERRAFYTDHQGILRTPQRPGYLQPPRKQIEFIIARAKADHVARAESILTTLANQAGQQASEGNKVDFEDLANEGNSQMPGTFTRILPPLFAAADADRIASDLAGAAPKLSDELFGENTTRYLTPTEKVDRDDRRGSRYVSPVFPCDAGRFFFRVIEDQPQQTILFEDMPDSLKRELDSDIRKDKASARARDMANAYRAAIYRTAFERFADAVGVTPVETPGLVTSDSPLPGLDKPVSAIYETFGGAEDGELSDLVVVDGKTVLAYLVENKQDEGMKIRLVVVADETLKGTVPPAAYEKMSRYDEAPYSFLDKAEPLPLEKVKDDIRALLVRRAALDTTRKLIDAARGELAADADLAAIAAKHKLTVHANVKVDLAKTEATPHIGKAAGFHDAVTDPDLKPKAHSPVLSSADGRFLFVLKSRDEKTATLDVAAVLFAEAAKEAKVDDAAILAYYDANADTAFLTKDEIKDAPTWEDLPDSAKARVAKALADEAAKTPFAERLRSLRTSAVLDAFRTLPAATPLTKTRSLPFIVRRNEKIDVASPAAPFNQPAVLDAVKLLTPGKMTAPVVTPRGTLIAYLVANEPEGTLTVDYVNIDGRLFTVAAEETTPADLQTYYDANKEKYALPERLQVEMLAVTFEKLDKDFAKAKDKARDLLIKAIAAIREKGGAPDLNAYAKTNAPLEAITTSYFDADKKQFESVGISLDLAEKAFAAKKDELVGPFLGTDGACVLRRLALEPGSTPPLDDVRLDVIRDLRQHRANARALEAAGKLHARILAEIAKSPEARTAFKNAIEAKPLAFDLPYPARVTLSDPVYPRQSNYYRSSSISGLGDQPALVRALFLASQGDMTEVIDAANQSACYVGLLTRFIPAPPPSSSEQTNTRRSILNRAAGIASFSWGAYVQSQLNMPR
ncbi:peptidyl-prolyl cis-trans isomerase [bacterium]|nr:peptidyl-prolyl cis-trans isomerase [bacterium]